MPGKKARIRLLEQRVAILEAQRDWATLPPANDIPLVDLPTLPDYTVPWVEYDVEEWNPTGYA